MKRHFGAGCAALIALSSAFGGVSAAWGAPGFSERFDGADGFPARSGAGWTAALVPGPGRDEVVTARAGSGFTGLHAMRFDAHGEAVRAVVETVPAAGPVTVGPESVLRYMIFPVDDPLSLEDPATGTALDVVFADGTRASVLGARDSAGAPLTPQGQARGLYPNQWNDVEVPLGAIAPHKRVAAIEVQAGRPGGAAYHVYFDDISIGDAAGMAGATPADLVDTRRGSNANGRYSRGNNFPAVAVPHGFNFWTPVTRGDSNWLYQYQERNDAENRPRLEAISLSHEPSPWMGDRQTFQVMPVPGGAPPAADRAARSASFDHAHEQALPYRYRVALDNGIVAEVAPTDHAAIMRFAYPGDGGQIAFDNLNDHGHVAIAPDGLSADGYTDVASGLSTGATRMFVHIVFDRPARAQGRMSGQKRDDVQAWAAFDTAGGRPVTVRIATSLIGIAQARRNMAMELPATMDFDAVAQAAKAQWNDRLGRVAIPGAPLDERKTLYGNLYRLYLYPNEAHENAGSVREPSLVHASPFVPAAGPDSDTQTGARIVPGTLYVNNGFWDTYRTAWPAYALLTGGEAGTLIDGFVQQYREGGWIARWSSPGYADLMTGTSADVAFADAWGKGVRNFDVSGFYRAALKDATVVPDDPGVGRKGLARAIFRGYTDTDTEEALSWSSASTLNDFAIGVMADKLAGAARAGSPERADLEAEAWYLKNRALNYVDLFDRSVGFFVGRRPDGAWRVGAEGFDPLAWGGDYTETNAWTMAFDPVQDGQGLGNLYGGRAGLARKLDAYFATPGVYHVGAYDGVIHEMREMHDVRMGQYSHSNQPAHHILYLYDVAGQPWKAQDKIRDAMDRLYRGSAIGQGYPGDEDNGEMSAWWIFSAAGFYPLRVGTPTYAIGAPRFETMRLAFDNGHTLAIEAPGVSDRMRFIQSVTLNGRPLTRWWLTHDEITAGGTLHFTMGARPSAWGTGVEAALPSLTRGDAMPEPARDLIDGAKVRTEGPAALFDNDAMTGAPVPSDGVKVTLPAAATVLAYTVTSGADAGEAAQGWELAASDDGVNWGVIDRRDGQHFAWKRQTRPFLIAAPRPHRFYRWRPVGARPAIVGELELLGRSG
ncbi:GH92 family glycosyl hydrolase [Gluconacetobacter takamatsuzukensis]|uniref:Glycoside hydrolase family 92 protein n=1 Tax=Gluconacetobacter takamatsuzukensis TaxID=1286190 RepID=A0A7W4KEK0_9PROT|nr:GH92 family glycosyl hydrolase [Gluconacetobacter takamatsuzukensis]MBB2205454.1 glycoside hydrolase family 92 protein [Gluconacetobacter takamatsuzukensis]